MAHLHLKLVDVLLHRRIECFLHPSYALSDKLDHVTHNILRQYYIIIGLTCETLVFAGGILLDVDSNVCVDPKHCGSCSFKAIT